MYIPIEDVKIQFEKALDVPYDWTMSGFTICGYAFGVLILSIGIWYFIAQSWRDFDDFKAVFPGIFVLALVFFCHAFGTANEQTERVQNNIAKWKKDYAIPYINTLPTERREVVFVKIEATSTQELKDHGGYLRSQEVNRTPLTVSYKDNGGVVTKTDWYNANMGLIADDKPYIEYVNLPEPLGVRDDGKKAEFWAGQYNYMVYLPMNYQFTDIK